MTHVLAWPTPTRATRVAGCLLLVFALLEVGSLRRQTLTTDENAHYLYGQNLLQFNSRRFTDAVMPFSMLNALPRMLVSRFRPDPVEPPPEAVELSRYVTVAAAALLGWLVFRWAGALYGPGAGLFALALFVFEPNILAHGALVTADLYVTWMLTLSVWSFWRFLNHEGPGRWRPATVSAVIFGLAQHAKYSAIYLAPIFLIILVGYAAPQLWALARARSWGPLAVRVVSAGKYAVLYVAAFIVIVNVGYWGEGSFRPLASYRFRSAAFRTIGASLLSSVPALRVPLPYAYVEGLDWVLALERQGTNIYLLGQLGKDNVPGRRFPEYYAVAWLYKEPIATQVLVLLAVVAYVLRFRRFDFRRNEWFLLCPVLFFALYNTFLFNYALGYRYAIVVLPLLFVFTSSLACDIATAGRGLKIGVCGLVIYLAASVLSYYPHFLAYFNEFVWDRKQSYRILAGSNLSWGQNKWYVAQYLRRHPDARDHVEGPQAGTFVLNANELVGIWHIERYRWLRENFEPVGHIGYAHLIFRVTPEALRRVSDPLRADWADKEP